MKLIHLSFLSIVIATSCAPPAANDSPASKISEKDREALTELKTKILPTAYDEQDTDLLREVMHESYLLVDDGGLSYDKTHELEYVAQYASSYDSLSFEIEKLHVFPNGTAMIFGTGAIWGTDISGAYALSYKSTDFFLKTGDEWQVVSSHVSGVNEVREGE